MRLDEIVLDVTNHMQVLAKEKGLGLEAARFPAMLGTTASPIGCASSSSTSSTTPSSTPRPMAGSSYPAVYQTDVYVST